jgi:Zn-dependent protease/CBS domain-containing protein
MTMMRTPGTAPTGRGTDPGRRRGGVRIAGFSIRLTGGAYLLAMVAVVVSALSLGAAVPGWPASAYAAATAGVVIVLLASMIGHELAHVVAARRHGAGSSEVSVGFFGGTVHGRYQLPTPRAQWRAAAAGPAVSLAAAGISVAAAAGLSALGAGQLTVLVFAVAAWINAVLGAVSLLPGAGLDGGQIIRAVAWARTGDPVRAGLAAARTGRVTGAALAAAGLVALALGHVGGLGLGLIGFLMIAASGAEARQVLLTAALAGLRVRDILPPSPVAAIHSWQTVGAFLDGEGPGAVRAGPAGSAATAFPLRDFDGGLAGILTLSQLAAVPAGRRETARLSEVATPIAHVVTTTPDEPLSDLLARMAVRPAIPAALHTVGYALVLGDDGAVAGVLTPGHIARASQVGALYRGGRAR